MLVSHHSFIVFHTVVPMLDSVSPRDESPFHQSRIACFMNPPRFFRRLNKSAADMTNG